MDDHLLKLPLGSGPLHNLLVDGVGCDQSVDHYWLGLPDSVTSVLSLEILLGIPVTVVNDTSVGRRQVDAETSSSDRKYVTNGKIYRMIDNLVLSKKMLYSGSLLKRSMFACLSMKFIVPSSRQNFHFLKVQ